MKTLLARLRNSKGVVMVVAMLIMLAITAIGLGMITSAAMNSTISKNYRNKLQSFYAADGQMAVIAQAVVDSLDSNWVPNLSGIPDSLVPRSSITMTSCPTQNGNVPTNANDGDTSTCWENANAEPKDSAWLRADCGSAISPSKVIINWDTLWTANSYSIQGSNDNATWFTLASMLNNTNGHKHRLDTLKGLSGSYRYILMRGIQRNGTLGHGYRIDEMQIYKYPNGTTMAADTAKYGRFRVLATISSLASNQFNIKTIAYDSANTWGKVFETTLNQYINRTSSGYYTTPSDTVWTQVTYRDFHEDRTCPEFEQKSWSGAYGVCPGSIYCSGATPDCNDKTKCPTPPDSLWKSNEFKNMVMRHLDADHKPVLNPRHVHSNAYVKYWFRDWDNPTAIHAKGDSTMPVYFKGAGDTSTQHWHKCGPGDELGGMDSNYVITKDFNGPTHRHDTAFKNYTIYDSLPWTWDAARHLYKIHNNSFFPLDGRGFATPSHTDHWNTGDSCGGSAGNGHNFGWTMELQTTMIKAPNQWFSFSGDDDLWVFINDTLVFDGGGRTHGGGDSVNTNNMPYLIDGLTYRFSVFYCERHSVGQSCNLETNMLQWHPTSTRQRSWARDYGNLQ